MKKFLFSMILVVVIAVDAAAQQEPTRVYIDVRTWVEHQADSIEGDPRIHVSEIVEGVTEQFPDKNTPIYLYCAVGGRAGRAAKDLSRAGYTNVHNAGGIDDVRKARQNNPQN